MRWAAKLLIPVIASAALGASLAPSAAGIPSLSFASRASGNPSLAHAAGSAAATQGAPARDPALKGLRIDVSSDDPDHRAGRVRTAANRGLSSFTFPRPVPFFAPPAQRVRTLVGIDTWFWVPAASWRPIVRIVAAGSVVVTLVATPVTLQFLPGDGSSPLSCPGPGLPWLRPGSRSLCSHRYQRASTATGLGRYRGMVQSLWTIRWTSSTGLSGAVGPVIVPTPVTLLVAEAQAVLGR